MQFELADSDFFEIRNNFDEFSKINSELLYGIRKEKCSCSIMIPTFLRNQYLKETIDSAINQLGEINYEIVVVDNNDDFTNHDTLELIKKYEPEKVSYYKNNKNLGMFGNWNRCLELSHADWVLILHDDDTIEQNYLSRMFQVINQHPSASCIGCRYHVIDELGKRSSAVTTKRKLVNTFFKNKVSTVKIKDFYYIHPMNIMGIILNRKKAIAIGGFDCSWNPISDYIFLLNLVYRFPAIHIDEKLINYRIAVNASLSSMHLIGMVEIDAFMRRCINEKIQVLNKKRDCKYRNLYSLNHQRQMEREWFFRLDDNEKEKVKNEYDKFNKSMGFYVVRDKVIRKHKAFQNFYTFYARYIRR